MARGNFWEVTYDPDWDGPHEDVELDAMDGTAGYIRRRIVGAEGETVKLHWTGESPQRHFQECDFDVRVKESLVSNCIFTKCRFRGSDWHTVKFSNCHFVKCEFSQSSFFRCTFVRTCTFSRISASAELFRIEETAISAQRFMDALETNLEHLATGYSVAHQQYRFVRTRQKLAKALYTSTKEEADIGYYFEAYEYLTKATLLYRVQEHRFPPNSRSPAPYWRWLLRSLPARTERRIILLSGALTNWGRSLLRAHMFFIFVLLLFAAIYAGNPSRCASPGHRFLSAFLESLNVTLIAGYTAHYDPNAALMQRAIWTTNAICGLFWYSLVVPVLSRKILR